MSRIGTLQGLAGLGSTATGQSAQESYGGGVQTSANDLAASGARVGVNQGYANQVSGLLTGQGNTNAAGIVGQTNSWLSALNNGTQSTLQYLAGQKPSGGGNLQQGTDSSGAPVYSPPMQANPPGPNYLSLQPGGISTQPYIPGLSPTQTLIGLGGG
jgi:hypothetical protein